jgi:hypothetical protein
LQFFTHNDVGSHQPIEVFQAKLKKERWKDAWVSPDGKWYNVEFGHHQGFAYHALKELYPDSSDIGFGKQYFYRIDNAGDLLKNLGWILVQCTGEKHWGVRLRGYENMTEKQFKILLSYFGEKKVLKTWTIRGLYLCKDLAKQKAKDED